MLSLCTFACTTFAVALAAEQHKPSNITIIRNQMKLGIMVALFVLYEQALLIVQSCGWIIDTCDECVCKSAVSTDKSSHVFYGFHIVSVSATVIENDEDLVDVCGLQTNKFHEIMQCEEWILIYLVFPKT